MTAVIDTDFYSAFLHELNQPLTSLRNGLELATWRETNDWPGVVEAAMADVDRMVELLELMGELRRFERAPATLADVDVAALLREVLADLGESANASGRSLAGNGTASAAWVRVAAELLRSALFRIVGDAIYHARAGQKITVSLHSDAGNILLDIAYPGILFAPNESEALLALAQAGRGPRGGITRRVFRLALSLRMLALQGARLELRNHDALFSALRIVLPASNSASTHV
jgi:signal transduction histidine kinase